MNLHFYFTIEEHKFTRFCFFCEFSPVSNTYMLTENDITIRYIISITLNLTGHILRGTLSWKVKSYLVDTMSVGITVLVSNFPIFLYL